jgi:hypothetical protein
VCNPDTVFEFTQLLATPPLIFDENTHPASPLNVVAAADETVRLIAVKALLNIPVKFATLLTIIEYPQASNVIPVAVTLNGVAIVTVVFPVK